MRDEQVPDLLRFVDRPVEPPPLFRSELQSELLQALAQPQVEPGAGGRPGNAAEGPVLLELERAASPTTARSRLGLWSAAAVAAAIMLGVVATSPWLSDSEEVNATDGPAIGSTVPVTNTVPIAASDACLVFIEGTSSIAEVLGLADEEPDRARELLEAWLVEFDLLRDRVDNSVGANTRRGLIDTRIVIRQALLQDPLRSVDLTSIDASLRQVSETDHLLGSWRR